MERHWDASKNYRLFEITNPESTVDILAKWKQYKNPIGFKLINMDFKHLYPKAESLLLKYDDFSVKIVPIFENEIKDPTSRQTLSEMMNNGKNLPENGRACGIFYLIHSLLIPTAKLITGSGSQKAITRFSIPS
ncbi:uncharacterized protein LOC129941510 [Eupeodes corollae]|uniref:uncharacterized protein LOC129941510 n=1 Tax=Eupeodes corollae TaxID=290404 RepID=UPI0024923A74|nr:uncharacterized protein LOC129941510 [Eupeodes corollae]